MWKRLMVGLLAMCLASTTTISAYAADEPASMSGDIIEVSQQEKVVPTGVVIETPMDICEDVTEPSNRPQESHLTKSGGVFFGPSGKETYYNLNMSKCVSIMESMGYNYEVWTRDDGVKMYGYYVMIAANTSVYPKGSILDTSMGLGIVIDHCVAGFIDIAVTW